MVVEQATQTSLDELNRCRDLAWSSTGDPKQMGFANPAKSIASHTRFEGLIHAGQNVFVTGDRSIGRIVKLLPGDGSQDPFLIVRAARIGGRHKILPAELVSDVNPQGVCLSIDRGQFQKLPDYKTDASLAGEVESALWNDKVLRVTDYREIDVRVTNGVVYLTGHITGRMNQARIESAVGKIRGILGMKYHLIADDTLLLKVAEALIQIGRVEGNHVFAKVENGVVGLSGQMVSTADRGLAEECIANIPWVRGVINRIAAPGIDLDADDQRFLQPAIGEKIYFRDGLFGFVRLVIINPSNRRVVEMIIQGTFPDRQLKSGSGLVREEQTTEGLAVIPVKVIRYLTDDSGFLLIDSTETAQYQDFVPERFVAPDADWVAPYPYCPDNVRFLAGS